jgi:hypothetical protein
MSLKDCNREEREWYMREIRHEAQLLRRYHEPIWLDLYEEWRALNDPNSPYRNKVRSTYAFTAVMSQISMLEPLFFANDPICEIASKWEEEWPSNQAHEAIITKQIQSRSNFRRIWAQILMESAVFGTSYPYCNWVHRLRTVGPFPNIVSGEGLEPLMGPDGTALSQTEYKQIQVYKGLELEYTSLWDTEMHPDGIRGFSIRHMTGYELERLSQGPNPLFDPSRVKRALRVAAEQIGGGPKKDRDDLNFAWGDDQIIIRDQLAQLAGTTAGRRTLWPEIDSSLRKNVMAFPFPVFFYDDGEFSGAYLLNRDSRMYELRFFQAISVDGTPNRLKLAPFVPSQEPYNTGLLEIGLGLLQARSRFLQLGLDGAELTVHPQWLVSDTYDRLNGNLMVGPGVVNVVPALGGKLEEHVARQDMPQSWVNAVQAKAQMMDPELDDLFAQDEHTKGQFPSGRHSAAAANLVGAANSARVELVGDRIDSQFARPLLRKMDVLNRAHFTKRDYEDYLGPIGARDVLEAFDPEKILRRNDYVFKGSVLTSNRSQLLARYPQMAESYLNALPLLSVPHVQEYYKRWFNDAGFDAITRLFPEADGQIRTDYAAAMGGGQGKWTGPVSPTDALGTMMNQGEPATSTEGRELGGAEAPRPPPNDMGAMMAGNRQSGPSLAGAL